jgi:hypothetical protein
MKWDDDAASGLGLGAPGKKTRVRHRILAGRGARNDRAGRDQDREPPGVQPSATEDLMPRFLVICCLGWATACGAAGPPVATAPTKRAPAVAQAKRVAVPSPPAVAHPRAPLTAELEPREQQEDAALRKAALLYQEFIDRAGTDPSYADAVRRSRERIADIEAILRFRDEGRRERALNPAKMP